jgi:4-oxalocrotonate tautomerase
MGGKTAPSIHPQETNMPTVHIELFAGRTTEQKRACAVAVTEAVSRTLGGSPDTLDVVFVEVERHRPVRAAAQTPAKPAE